jgi:hypothetical protein
VPLVVEVEQGSRLNAKTYTKTQEVHTLSLTGTSRLP